MLLLHGGVPRFGVLDVEQQAHERLAEHGHEATVLAHKARLGLHNRDDQLQRRLPRLAVERVVARRLQQRGGVLRVVWLEERRLELRDVAEVDEHVARVLLQPFLQQRRRAAQDGRHQRRQRLDLRLVLKALRAARRRREHAWRRR